MKIISWNVNGYRAVWKKNVFDWVNEFKPDVLCVQETKAWEEQLTKEQINPHGYTGCFSKAEKKGYSGVATSDSSHIQKVLRDSESRISIVRADYWLQTTMESTSLTYISPMVSKIKLAWNTKCGFMKLR